MFKLMFLTFTTATPKTPIDTKCFRRECRQDFKQNLPLIAVT